VSGLLEGFVELLAPSRCAGCEERCASAFCEACQSLLEPAGTPGAVFQYGGPVADAIHSFKYRGRSYLGATLGSLMAEVAVQWSHEIDAVVPVPLHWRRRRSRGYDQAALLAKPIAQVLRVPLLLNGLRRTRHTASQIELPHDARRLNVAGAFASYRIYERSRVLLVDDVRTTGATLEAAESALGEAGVTEVRTLVLATRLLRGGT
jgi:ComF family protein